MANNNLLVNERQADLGNFIVGRLLPFREKRQVGPFTFIDHMGPSTVGPGKYVDVDQHPHIGLSTLTYLFEGEIEHRDSIGSVQVIKPGDVGFMTSGSGVTHTERTPQARRQGGSFTMHGYQIWVALPKEKEEMAPEFNYYPSDAIPTWQTGDLTFRLVAGEAFGRSAPLQGFSPLFMVDIYAEKASTLHLGGQLRGEVAFVIVRGAIKEKEALVKAGQMLISKTDEQCEVCLEAGTQLLLFGGEPLPDEPLLRWNFVSHSKARLAQARVDWENKNFPMVPGDNTYIPFP
ncbi:pirin family protein [Neolewinella persica]|uniref:pirin family protein n=1 Tax=Neolewinella persica TaxID=70998 RepID=UPI0003808F2C|nr:pirin family protein [Neolewinella persica]